MVCYAAKGVCTNPRLVPERHRQGSCKLAASFGLGLQCLAACLPRLVLSSDKGVELIELCCLRLRFRSADGMLGGENGGGLL